MNRLFIAPHNDDETLFGAITLMRKKPVVLIVTDSWLQYNRGENITADQRRDETLAAMKIAGCPVIFGGIRDDCIDSWSVGNLLTKFDNFDEVFAPAVQGGNPHHDLIGEIAAGAFGPLCKVYTTYSKEALYTTGEKEIVPTDQERVVKDLMLNCYLSQKNLAATAPHFEAVKGKSEWFI